MNLYLYIPRLSAHSPAVFESFIQGSLKRYWLQNTNIQDFKHIMKLFFHRLMQRGYPLDETAKLFQQTCEHLDRNPPELPTSSNTSQALYDDADLQNDRPLFLHSRYHPQSVPRRVIHETFRKHFTPSTPHSDNIRAPPLSLSLTPGPLILVTWRYAQPFIKRKATL